MSSDDHKIFEHRIDETLAGGIAPQEEESLREHLQSCVQCQEYLTTGTRVIAGLGGFSFDVDPALKAKVCASIRVRAQQIEARQPRRRQLALIFIIALVLTAAGSFIDLQFSGLIASVLDLQRTPMRQGLLTFWILPSLCLLLLFPILPLLSHPKERVL
jgi:hypothetical protein